MDLDSLSFQRFEVKSFSPERREIEGVASTSDVDLVNDIVQIPGAFTKTLKERGPSGIEFRINHDYSDLPVGAVVSLEEQPGALKMRARVFKTTAGDDVLETIRELRALGKSVGLSIGFRIRDARMERRGTKAIRVLTDVDLHEISVTTTPANTYTAITGIKSRPGGGMPSEKEAADPGGQATYPNTLPDSAFLHIAEGGVLDDEGKTVPRGLRHFRFLGADGALDREALAVTLTEIPGAKTVIADDRERARLAAHARRLTGVDTKTQDAPEWRSETALDLLSVAYGLQDAVAVLAEQHKALAVVGQTTNDGRRMPAVMREQIEQASKTLAAIAEQALLVEQGKDAEALADWWQAQFELMGVAS